MIETCVATNALGNRCGARPQPGKTLCHWHDPDRAAEMAEARRRGGEGRSNRARARKKIAGDLRDMVGVKAMLLEGMQATKDGTMEPAILTALSTAARAVVVVAGVADFQDELSEMRRELAEVTEFVKPQGAS